MNKNMFRRVVSFVLIAAMTLGLTACSGGNVKEAQGNKYKIITTIFPEYDWVREIVGQGHLSADKSAAEDYDITMLLDNGVDLHSFQPTAADIANISTCDMFIYVGGESDGWVDDALKELHISLDDTDLFITHLHADHSGQIFHLKTDKNKAYA